MGDTNDIENWSKPIIPILNGYNYLDMGWDPNGDIWAGGGNGTLIVSKDQGKTWNKDPIASELPTNYIKILFDSHNHHRERGRVLRSQHQLRQLPHLDKGLLGGDRVDKEENPRQGPSTGPAVLRTPPGRPCQQC